MAKKKDDKPAVPEPNVLEKLDVEYIDVNAIFPNSYNPNRQSTEDFDLLVASMRDDGFTQPVIVDRASMEVVDGEHRWRAAQVIGMDKIPVVLVDMTAEQRRISTLRHNRARGSEDMTLAGELLRDLEARGATDWILEGLNMDPAELENILADAPKPESDDAPEVIAAIAANPDDNVGIANARRAAEGRIETEKLEQAVVTQARDRDLFRIDLSYTDDEGDVVKRVLGTHPAKMLLELCADEVARAAAV